MVETKATQYGDPLEATDALCKMLSQRVVAVIGPSSPDSAFHAQNMCDVKEIPLIETHNDGTLKYVINLHPTPEDMGKAFMFLIEQYNWEGFTILFKDSPW